MYAKKNPIDTFNKTLGNKLKHNYISELFSENSPDNAEL